MFLRYYKSKLQTNNGICPFRNNAFDRIHENPSQTISVFNLIKKEMCQNSISTFSDLCIYLYIITSYLHTYIDILQMHSIAQRVFWFHILNEHCELYLI